MKFDFFFSFGENHGFSAVADFLFKQEKTLSTSHLGTHPCSEEYVQAPGKDSSFPLAWSASRSKVMWLYLWEQW